MTAVGMVVLAVVLSAGPVVFAQSGGDSVGLGVAVGAAFPSGGTASIPSGGQASLNWGFFVNIPLLYTFHIAPSSELYKLGGQNATDMDLAFKFIIPLARFSLFVGAAPGLTAVADVACFHAGVLGGAAFNLVSNLDCFVLAKYAWIFEGSRNMTALHLNAGLQFNFR